MRAFRRTCAGASEPQLKVISPDQRGRPFVSAINRRKSSFGMLPSFSDLNGTLAWDIGIGTGNRGKSSSLQSSNRHVSDSRTYVFCPASGDNWASTEPITALVRFQHHTCEEGGIVVLERGEKAPYRHLILATGSSILWKVLCCG